MTPLAARTANEAHLYMDLRLCGCGAGRFPRGSSILTLFLFRLPAEPESGEEGFRYGAAEPSTLIDAGQWLWVAEGYAPGRTGRCRAVTAGRSAAVPDTPGGGCRGRGRGVEVRAAGW